MNTAAAMSTSPMTRTTTTLDLDLHDVLDDDRADGDHDRRDDQSENAVGRLPERAQVLLIDHEQEDEQADRKRGKDPPRHAALRGESAREAAELLAHAYVE